MRVPRTAGTFLMTKSDGILHKACRRIGATNKPNDTFRIGASVAAVGSKVTGVQVGEDKIQDAKIHHTMGELEDFIYKYFIIVDQAHGIEVSAELRQRLQWRLLS